MGRDTHKVFSRIHLCSLIGKFKEEKGRVGRNRRYNYNAAWLTTKTADKEKKRKYHHFEDLWRLIKILLVDRNLKVQQENHLQLKLTLNNYKKWIIFVKIKHFQATIPQAMSCFPVEGTFSLKLSTFLINRNVPAHSFGRSQERYQYVTKSDD